jgi:hypothetical protein
MNRIRVRITKTFEPKPGEPGHGFKYVEDAVVGVTIGVARQWIAEGNAKPFDEAAAAALADAPATPPPAA